MNDNPSLPLRHLTDPTPRSISLFTKAVVLLGGALQVFGWVFFTFGSLFCWIFLPASDLKYILDSDEDWNRVSGELTAYEATNSSVNKQRVYRCEYWYAVAGQRYTGKSYTVRNREAIGEKPTVLYRKKAPQTSYLEGTERAVFPSLVAFVLLFPLIGLFFIIYTLSKNWRMLRLLEIGEYTRGKLVGKQNTNGYVKIGNTTYPIFAYRFEFEVGGQTHVAQCKTHQGWLVEDEEREIILYDRFNPSFNDVFDAMPNAPAITEEGMLASAPTWKAVYFLLPLAAIGLHLMFLMLRPVMVE